MSAKYSNKQILTLVAGVDYLGYLPGSLTPTNSVQVINVNGVFATSSLQTTNLTIKETAPITELSGGINFAGPATASQYWSTETSINMPVLTGSTDFSAGLIHYGNAASKFARVLISGVDVGGEVWIVGHGKE